MEYKLRKVSGREVYMCRITTPSPYYYLSDIDQPYIFKTYNDAYQQCYYWNTNSSRDKVEIVDELNNQVSDIVKMDGYKKA